MAIVKYSAAISEIRGKVGGAVFQRCGQSLSLRSNPSHIYARSESAVNSRSKFASLANSWNQLTQSQRNSFTAAASSYPTYDKWGNSIILTGYQLYIYVNRYAYFGDYDPTVSGFSYVPLDDINFTGDDMFISLQECDIHFSIGDFNGTHVITYISDPFLPGKLMSACKFRFLINIDSEYTGSSNIYSVITDLWKFPPTPGYNFYMKHILRDYTKGYWLELSHGLFGINA